MTVPNFPNRPRTMMRIESAQLTEVIRLEVLEGYGTPGDIARHVLYFCDPESGDVLARVDTMSSLSATYESKLPAVTPEELDALVLAVAVMGDSAARLPDDMRAERLKEREALYGIVRRFSEWTDGDKAEGK